MSKRRLRVVLYGRHYCSICDNRVFPYDSMEKDTEAPVAGARQERILLFSANAARARKDPENPGRLAWCFVDKRWVETYRLTRSDIIQRYLARRGVSVRFRRGGAVLKLQKRRSA